MGTSASGGGAGNNNPLIPGWIGNGGGAPPPPEPPLPLQPERLPDHDNPEERQPQREPIDNEQGGSIFVPPVPKRFVAPRRNFNKFVKSGGTNERALNRALKDYSRNAAGGTQQMARRMQPAVSRVLNFYEVINNVKQNGTGAVLAEYNLTAYADKPLVEILSSLSDEIFKDSGKIFEETQDDSIVKQAYANTVVRICEMDGIDLDNITNEQVEVMMAIFIEETIAQRVICDIGNNLTKENSNIQELLEIEENVYQIISGLVRNQIMPEIIATQRGDKKDLEMKIENIYRHAYDAMAGLND